MIFMTYKFINTNYDWKCHLPFNFFSGNWFTQINFLVHTQLNVISDFILLYVYSTSACMNKMAMKVTLNVCTEILILKPEQNCWNFLLIENIFDLNCE